MITTLSYRCKLFCNGFNEIYDTFCWWRYYIKRPFLHALQGSVQEDREKWWDLYMNLSGKQ